MGMQLSRLPLQTALGELLIANESSKAALLDSKTKASELFSTNENLQQTLRRFSRFVPAKFLEDIGVESPLDSTLGRHVETHKAVMFADLRGFTTISEQLDAGQIFEVINQYLACTVPCVEANGGYVLQYLGDGILALFPSNSTAALKAAIDMQKALRECQEQHSALPFRLRMSIGIHQGPVALGIVGMETRWDASIIADAVNTSARIEAMTRVLGGDIMVSQHFLENAGDTSGFEQRKLGVQQIRGRKGLLPLVEILDSLDQEELESRRLTTEQFNNGITAYQSGDMYLAMAGFSQVLSQVPTDLAAQFYLARISQRLNSLPS
jgi:class 3 adenylate cyclase